MLSDAQYDYLEKTLVSVESRHPEIAKVVTDAGYCSPSDYVDSLRLPSIANRAEWMLRTVVDLTCFRAISQTDTDLSLYEAALPRIHRYPL
jgi:hypothetical protein